MPGTDCADGAQEASSRPGVAPRGPVCGRAEPCLAQARITAQTRPDRIPSDAMSLLRLSRSVATCRAFAGATRRH